MIILCAIQIHKSSIQVFRGVQNRLLQLIFKKHSFLEESFDFSSVYHSETYTFMEHQALLSKNIKENLIPRDMTPLKAWRQRKTVLWWDGTNTERGRRGCCPSQEEKRGVIGLQCQWQWPQPIGELPKVTCHSVLVEEDASRFPMYILRNRKKEIIGHLLSSVRQHLSSYLCSFLGSIINACNENGSQKCNLYDSIQHFREFEQQTFLNCL